MSFILDALKKSEAERQRQNAPGIASIAETGQPRSHSRWFWLIILLLVVNLGVVITLFLRPGPETTTAIETTVLEPTATAESETAAEPAAEPERFVDMVREAKRSAPPSAAESPPSPEPAMTDAAEAVESERLPEAVTAVLPTFNELRADGTLELPEMHLDIHVYSGQPADRFVFVNMSKYKESATLAEGPVVREITQDGVVLDFRGTRFLLPRE